MNKIFITMLLFLSLAGYCNPIQHTPTIKEQKNFDKIMDERLNLTQEQKNYIKSNRAKHFKEMEKTISKMEVLHKKIKNVYILGIPKYQADLRTAPYKAELAILSQNAQKQRAQFRKNFESILTPEQKIEFEQMKKERAQKKPRNHRNIHYQS